ncbi:hypothetical protein [Streptomyces sp. Isolate_45]|uniref:hypothetical protein n=1 Tax=Streptomyces sp. Isolate_45 TaxID=2950111 RepID=UPI0024820DF5|nr:hypothetical protein [Streptomyces sp. Isolate_45]MDA5281196.1 hypothetical protein [Streptomyces sp. Isolate_45]
MADRLARRGGVDVALKWLVHAPGVRGPEVLLHEGVLNEQAHRLGPALRCYREAGAVGSTYALRQAARLLVVDGRFDEALGCLDEAAGGGDSKALTEAASHLGRAGRVDEALVWHERAVAAGEFHALISAYFALAGAGRPDEARLWRRRAVAAGVVQDADMPDMKPAAAKYEGRAGVDPDTVLEECEREVRCGSLSVKGAATALERAGQMHPAQGLRRFGWDPDGGVARPWKLTPAPSHPR